MNTVVPNIEQWYCHLDKGEVFQVVGIDNQAGTIEIQFFGGDLDEIDLESWDAMALAHTEPPEDWTGPVDDVERDDLGNADAEAETPNLIQPPAPLGIEAWDDTRDGAIDLLEDEMPTMTASAAIERSRAG